MLTVKFGIKPPPKPFAQEREQRAQPFIKHQHNIIRTYLDVLFSQ